MLARDTEVPVFVALSGAALHLLAAIAHQWYLPIVTDGKLE